MPAKKSFCRRQKGHELLIRQKTDKGTGHENFGMREEDHQENTVDHRLPESNERVERAESKPVDEQLEDHRRYPLRAIRYPLWAFDVDLTSCWNCFNCKGNVNES